VLIATRLIRVIQTILKTVFDFNFFIIFVLLMVANFKKKKKGNPLNYIFSVTGGIILIILISFLVYKDVSIYRKKIRLNEEIAELKEKIEQAKLKNENLKENIAQADSKDYLEKVAREQLDMQKPGETVVAFITSQESQKEENAKEKKSWIDWVSGALSGTFRHLFGN